MTQHAEHAPAGHFLDELRATFVERAGQPALSLPDRSYTFGEIERRAERCAAWLEGLGVGLGDRVVLATSEKRPFLAAHLGGLFAGAVALRVNPRFASDAVRD